MTKEELEKEADEYVTRTNNNDFTIEAYLAGAEPREKQIAELSKHIVELQNDKGELIDRCRELEAQIEKMKCCQNCSHLCGLCELGINGCYVCSKWELRR